ncbi:MAG: hypothetical protein H6704_07810 [Myxococcales bacterium]|nr:hypothetical protein [Myxococcales bacterium]MCB9536156.1 hypothetical protein [Myxococcales bacterium]
MRRLLALALALGGCSSVERGEGLFPDLDAAAPDAAPPANDGGPRVDMGATGPLEDAAGQWLLWVEDRKCLEALGTSVENIIWSTYLVDIAEVSEDDLQVVLRQHVQLCGQELSPLVAGLRTVVPPAIPDSLESHYLSGFLLGREPGDAYFTAELVDLWGASDIAPTEALPSSVDDPRVEDTEGDDAPGVTFVVVNRNGEPACDVQVVQRTRLRFRGTVVGPDRIEGEVQSAVDKVVLAASSGLCSSDTELPPSEGQSRFVLRRAVGAAGGLDLDLDGSGAIDCGEVRDAEQLLMQAGTFPRATPDDGLCR